jgi:hypothetical protein
VDNAATTIRLLLELIAGLDRRVPQMERAGEAAIALDAAALKAKAFARIAELEAELEKAPNDKEAAHASEARSR